MRGVFGGMEIRRYKITPWAEVRIGALWENRGARGEKAGCVFPRSLARWRVLGHTVRCAAPRRLGPFVLCSLRFRYLLWR